MRKLFALLGSLGLLILPGALRAAPRAPAGETKHTLPTVAISDFPGDDKSLSAFVSETLLTDLGHSDRLQTLERTEFRQALSDLDMRDSGPLTPGQVRHVGDLIHASHLVVGSLMVHDDLVVINVRVLDTASGLNVPGSSLNASGPRKGLLSVTHKLAHQLHRKLTGEDLVLEDDALGPAPSQIPEYRDREPAPLVPEELDPLENSKRLGLIPSTARPNGPLAENDLAGFLGRLARQIPTDSAFRLAQSVGPVSRMQALTGIVKTLLSAADLTSFRSGRGAGMTVDAAQIPTWGQPYLAAALDQGWWDASAPFRPRETATWAFIQHIVGRLPLHREISAPREQPRPIVVRPRVIEAPIVNENYTGLVVDARDFDLKRDHSPRVIDEDGNEVYPDPKHCPSPDYVEQHGMASYATSEYDSNRAGAHPLVVRAIATAGPGPFDVVISNEDARRVLEANRRTRFLWKWSVTLVVVDR